MSVETLDRLAQIIDGLEPLGDAGRGEPVLAAEWNTLVAGVQELARIAVARERSSDETLAARFARVDHNHVGAVDLTWFDPETRSLIEGGRAQRADLAAELARTQRDLKELAAGVEAMRLELADVKRQIDEIDDRDRDRAGSVDRLSGRVEAMGDNATSIADLRGSLRTIDGRVGEALSFRDELVGPDGNRVDIATLRADVTDVLSLRDNLRGADGRVVEYRDFERRVVALEERPTGPGGQPPFDLDDFRDQVLVAADERFAPRFTAVDDEFDTIRDDLAGLDGRTVSLEDTRTTHGAQITALQGTATTLPGLQTRVDTLDTRVSGHDTAIATMGPLRDRVSAAETTIGRLVGLEPRMAAAENGLVQAGQRFVFLDSLAVRVTAIEQVGLPRVDQRVDGLASDLARSQEETRQIFDRVTVLESRSDDLNTRFGQVEAQTTANRRTVDLIVRDVQDLRTRVPAGPIVLDPRRPPG